MTAQTKRTPTDKPQVRQVIGLDELIEIAGLSRSTAYRRMADDPEFPRPFNVGSTNRLKFFLDEVVNYLERQPRRVFAAPEPTEASERKRSKQDAA